MEHVSLLLQGSGALGAYELGVVKRLYEDPGFSPDIITGVSIGAINGAVLAGSPGNPVQSLQRMWDEFTVISPFIMPDCAERFLSLFGNISFFKMRSDYLTAPFWTSFYNTDPLRRVLTRYIDFDKLNDGRGRPRLLLKAMNVKTGRIETFDSGCGAITIDHLVASCSMPPGFPMTRLMDNYYWDGSLFDHTPLLALHEGNGNGRNFFKRIIAANIFPIEGKIPLHMLDVLDRTLHILLANQFGSGITELKQLNELASTFKALDDFLPKDSPIRTMPGFVRLKTYTFFDDIILIENKDPELVKGHFDFTAPIIAKRIAAGYHDTAKVVAQKNGKSEEK